MRAENKPRPTPEEGRPRSQTPRRLAPGLLLLVAAWTLPALAEKGLPPLVKQLAGPPSEFAAMAPPPPEDTARRSRGALLPVTFERTGNGPWIWSSQLDLGMVHQIVQLTAPDASWEVTATDGAGRNPQPLLPSGEAPLLLPWLGPKVVATGLSTGSAGAVRGRLTIHSEQPDPGFLVLRSDDEPDLVSHLESFDQRVGRPIRLVARLEGAEGRALQVDDARMKIVTPGGTALEHPVSFDGSDASGHFLPRTAGQHQVQLIVSGRDVLGNRFVRTTEHVVPVVEDKLLLGPGPAVGSLRRDSRVSVSIPVLGTEAGKFFRAYAELWGTDPTTGALDRPVAWIGGMTRPDGDRLDLGLDPRWIERSGAAGPFELRNVRVEELAHFLTVASAPRLPLRLPRRAWATGGPRPIVIDEAMRFGPGPERLGPEFSAPEGGGQHRLLLVHGYCSSDVWGPVSGQFDNASVFLDLGQNRLNDDFAQQILAFGSAWDSYAIVAHSQGGLAALHLLNYYWSGLDLAGPGRLIQSVGSPYQGTPLAGLLAIIGDIFGAGCGTNTDLTPEGAALWLAGISPASRAEVHYHTTSFADGPGIDFCHLASDLFLTDPEDGVVEQSRGQLPGGVDEGHEEGWCHSSGMRDPPQTTDASRNATMSSTAATGAPDLLTDPFFASATVLDPHESFTLFATVENDGTADADASTLRYYLSTDADIDPSDTELGSDPIPILVPGEISAQSLDIAAPSTPGTHFVGACVDVVSDEPVTANNCSSSVELTVVQPEVGPLVVQGLLIDDDDQGDSSGDGDGVARCGETVELFVQLVNQGGDSAEAVSGTLSSSDPLFTGFLGNDASTYPDIPGGASAWNDDDFEFLVDPETPDRYELAFAIDTLSAGGGPWVDDLSVTVSCPDGCAAPDELEIFDEVVDGERLFEACASITAGPNVTVEGPAGHAILQAPAVALESGVAVESGGRLTILNGIP